MTFSKMPYYWTVFIILLNAKMLWCSLCYFLSGRTISHKVRMNPWTQYIAKERNLSVVNGVTVSEISGPFSTSDIANNCISSNPLREPIMWIISYTLMSLCGIILLILIILLLLPNRRHGDEPEVVNDESSLVRHRWK